MRWLVAVPLLLAAPASLVGGQGANPTYLLKVDDGLFMYDSLPNDGVCRGDSNNFNTGVALHHWNLGVPLMTNEPQGGFGCLGGPRSWTFTLNAPSTFILGRVRYTWDQDVAGGGANDVQLHVRDAVGAIVRSTVFTDGPQPTVPVALATREHVFNFVMLPGTYVIEEDVFSGQHTAWVSKVAVVVPG